MGSDQMQQFIYCWDQNTYKDTFHHNAPIIAFYCLPAQLATTHNFLQQLAQETCPMPLSMYFVSKNIDNSPN